MTDKEKNVLQNYRNELIVAKRKDRVALAFNWFTKSAIAKIASVQQYLADVLGLDDEDSHADTRKLICFCHHQAMLDGVEEMLNRKRVNHIRIDGTTQAKLRQEACETFQTNPKFRVALLSLTACATGLNLTAASLVIFSELYWNPGVLSQVVKKIQQFN